MAQEVYIYDETGKRTYVATNQGRGDAQQPVAADDEGIIFVKGLGNERAVAEAQQSLMRQG